MSIKIIPFGHIDNYVLDYLKENLILVFNAEITIGQAQLVPDYAYNNKRGQYYSTAILENLLRFKESKDEKILAVIDEDLYVPQLNFVFGEADILNRICIISLRRLRQSYYGLKEDRNLFLKRSLKEAVHEIGHLLNLRHCPDPRCVMYFSNTLLDTDRKDYNFCGKCQKLLP